MARHRVLQTIDALAATAVNSYGPIGSSTSPARIGTHAIDDIVDGTRNAHPMLIHHQTTYGWSVVGVSRPTGNIWTYNGYTVSKTWSHQALPTGVTEPTDNSAISTLLARTNPNKPKQDLPQFVIELKDIPHMLRQWGHDIYYAKRITDIVRRPDITDVPGVRPMDMGDLNNLPRYLGEKNLEWNFAIAPFFGDIMKIVQFQQNVEKKLAMLRRLQNNGSAGGKTVVWEHTVTSGLQQSYVTPLYQEDNIVEFRLETTRKKWGTTNWRPTVKIAPKTDQENMGLAIRLAYGLDVNLSTLWKVFPWSWLVDWFSNAGEILDGMRNLVPVSHDQTCIMLQTTTRIVGLHQISGPGIFTATPPTIGIQDKVRRVPTIAAPFLNLHVPFLDGKQLSLLASLAVTRRVPTS